MFSAGGDIKNFYQNDLTTYPHSHLFKRLYDCIKVVRKPIISVVQGKALGGGF